MLHNKGFIAVFLTALIALTSFTGVGIAIAGRGSQTFAGDGYILSAETASGKEGESGVQGAEESSAPDQFYFAAGTKYKKKYPESAVFKDIQGKRQTVGAESFVHYADDSLSALTDGVLVNMDDIDTGVANHYGIKAGVVLAKDGNGYSVENNGNAITFTNFIWKLSDSRFVVASDGMELTLPDGTTQTISGVLEGEYVEDGIVSLMDTENKWQVVADGTTLAFADGVSYDFGDKIIKDSTGTDRMTFQELLLDADDNIRVQSAEEWKAPEFDFEVIDGQDGEKGKNGQAGAAGEAGEAGEAGADGEEGEDGDDGEDGDEGSTGSKGQSGSSGSNGSKGLQGSKGTLTNADTVPQATFTLTDFNLTAGTLEITFEVSDEGPVLPDNAEDASGAIRLLDPSGNEMEWDSNGNEPLNYTDNGALLFQDGGEYGIKWKDLNPDTEYRLVISSGYTLKNVQGKRDYINRTFYTDSTGLQLEKTYATETGFVMTLTKKDFSETTGATIQIMDSKGNVLLESSLSNIETGETTLDTSKAEFDVVSGSRELTPNTSYKVSLTGRGSSKNSTGRTQTWKTLKRKPVLGKSVGYTGSRAYFDLGVESVEDPDKSILSYRYEIYEADSVTETAIKTITSDKKSGVPLYISTDTTDNPYIARGKKYRVKVVAIYNDNEKQAEIAAQISDTFQMNSVGSISVTYEPNRDSDNKITALNGIVVVDPRDATGLIGIGGDKGLTLMIESTGYYKRTFEFLERDLQLQNGVYNLPLNLTGLRANSSYRISVWGYVELSPGSDTFVYTMLDDFVTSTKPYDSVYVNMAPAGSETSALSCYVYLGKDEDPGELTFTQNAIRAVEVKLYTGSTPQESNFVKSGFVIEDRENPQMAATGKIAQKYYGDKGYKEGNRLEITDSTFDLSPSDLTSSNYCVQVSAIYDYTKYYNYEAGENQGYWNEIPLSADSVSTYELEVNKYVPPLPTPLDSAVDATPITFGQLGRYGITYTGSDKDLYDDNTIVGYHLNAHFDNSGHIARSVSYYAVTEKDIVDYAADAEKGANTDVMLWREKQTNAKTPFMEITLPVQVKASSLPSVNVMFFEASKATEATGSIESAWAQSLQNSEVNANKSYGVEDKFIGGTDTSAASTTVFAPKLKRGWHYLFTYTTRLDFNGSYRYPNNYTGGFQEYKTLLSSGLKGVPKQGTDVKMYMDNTTKDSTDANVGIVSWKYRYTDLDHAAAHAFEEIKDQQDLFDVFAAYRSDASSASSLIKENDNQNVGQVETVGSEGYRTMNVRMDGNGSYRFSIKQKLYDPEDLNQNDAETTETTTELAESSFVVPYESQTLKSSITLTAGTAVGNTLPVYFNFGTGKEDLVNRVVLVKIWAVDAAGKKINNTELWYRNRFMTAAEGGSPYLNYDLSRAATSVGDTVRLRAEILYDTGFGGKSLVQKAGSNDRFTVALSDGSYLNWAWGDNGLQLKKSTSGAWSANYQISAVTPTAAAQYNAEEGWKLENTFTPDAYPEDSFARPVLNLRKTAKGDYDVVQTFYPVFRKTESVQPDSTLECTVTSLAPSVTLVDWKIGITTLDINMHTSSYSMIQETEHDGKRGKYIHVVLRKLVGNPAAPSDEIAWENYVELNQDESTRYAMTADSLESGESYQLSMFAVTNGETDESLLLYSGGGTSHPMAQWQPITIESTMEIKNLTLSDIAYNSYTDKSISMTYGLSTLNGYELQYRITQERNGEEVVVADHEQVLGLMGYELRDGVWGKVTGNGGFTPWSRNYQMSETISLSPKSDAILKPGNTYKLYVKTVAGTAQTQLAEESVTFTWPSLLKPPFYVMTSPSGNSLLIRINPADENRVLVDGAYIAAVWSEGKCAYVSGVLKVEDGPQTLNGPTLPSGSSYEIAIYGVMDMDNTGGKTAISNMTAKDLEKLTDAKKSELGVYSKTEKTLDSWGGRYEEIKFSFNGAGYLYVEAFNAYDINKVKKIIVTIYNKSTNETKNFIKTASEMFSQDDPNVSDFNTVVPTDGSYTTKGSYAITMECRDDNDQYLFRVTGNATIR